MAGHRHHVRARRAVVPLALLRDRLAPHPCDGGTLVGLVAATIAAALLLITLAPSFPLAIAAYAAAGIVNAYFFAATLAARSEYAPDNARGQIFVWVGALKITAGSAGTAAAGALISASLLLTA